MAFEADGTGFETIKSVIRKGETNSQGETLSCFETHDLNKKRIRLRYD